MKRSPELQAFMDEFTKKTFGKSLTECEEKGICTTCHEFVGGFSNDLGEREYRISGMCQKCQDKTFD